MLNADKEILENLNGRLDINLLKLDNPLLDNGRITFSINEGKIKVLNSYIELEGLGIIKSSFNYLIKEDELFLKTTNILNINNNKQFAKKFQLNQKKIENINQIYFDFERNIDSGEMHISNIFVNSKNNQNLLEEVLEVKNIQVLKSIMRELLN